MPPKTSTLICPVDSPKHSTSIVGIGFIKEIWLGLTNVIFEIVSVQLFESVTTTSNTPSDKLLIRLDPTTLVSPNQLKE